MKNYKVFTLLRTLDKNEIAAFSKYIKQKHANERVALPVFRYIRKFYPEFIDKKKLNITFIYQKVFGKNIENEKYYRKKILNALSDLHLWLKEFLLLEKIRTDSFSRKNLWLSILKERGLEVGFSTHAKQINIETKDFPKKNIMVYLQNMTISFLYYNHYVQGRLPPDIEALRKCNNDLDLFYAVSKLKLGCEIKNIENLFSFDLKIKILPPFSGEKKYINYKKDPLLLLYNKAFKLLLSNNSENYIDLDQLLSEKANYISNEEIHIFHSYLHNFAATQIRLGKEDYWEKIHRLNKLGLEHHIFTKKGVMSSVQFNNIVNIACKVKDFNWVSVFIVSQSRYLKDEIRDSTVCMAKANILFEQGEFKKALNLLEKVNTKDTRQTIRLKAFVLRCQFEIMDDENNFFDYCNTFEAFLRRNRKPKKEIIEATMNFIKLIKMLIREKIEKDIILERIKNTSPVYFKTWLLEKTVGYNAKYAAHKRNL
jgi:tetratricopeptide (TPR) repeat protein